AYAHKLASFEPPINESVEAVMRGVRRKLGTAQKGKAPATATVVAKLVKRIPDDLSGKRDKALILIGFAAALRRSELVALTLADVERALAAAVGGAFRRVEGQEPQLDPPILVQPGHWADAIARRRRRDRLRRLRRPFPRGPGLPLLGRGRARGGEGLRMRLSLAGRGPSGPPCSRRSLRPGTRSSRSARRRGACGTRPRGPASPGLRRARSTSITYCSIYRRRRRSRRRPLHPLGRRAGRGSGQGARRSARFCQTRRELVRGWRHILMRLRRFVEPKRLETWR